MAGEVDEHRRAMELSIGLIVDFKESKSHAMLEN